MPDDVPHSFFRKLDLLFGNSVLVNLPWNQVLEGNVNLLFFRVALEFDDLHAVAQRLGNGIEHVGGRDEKHLGKVKRHVEVVIAECKVLFRIESLKESRCRIAPEIAPDFVDFVEHEDRVFRLGTADALNDLARQSPNVSATMAANLGFIVHATE